MKDGNMFEVNIKFEDQDITRTKVKGVKELGNLFEKLRRKFR